MNAVICLSCWAILFLSKPCFRQPDRSKFDKTGSMLKIFFYFQDGEIQFANSEIAILCNGHRKVEYSFFTVEFADKSEETPLKLCAFWCARTSLAVLAN